ncbi:acyltransferase family protein [Anaerobiospirillum thomasii]|uniref:O-acetyltransferase OatA n=1 Tax=Anaerobiospirillum thomasii TaxID=179995 RepID=A0A2X0WQH9_9GAMM|nr:acyltransferase family protein [Anaerobiospirillum thomasii]SPT68832.1 O-acetyltransferase OatA [Anaerobiospirillum thomasii]
MSHKEFRKDIAGLRALAVLLVIIFHLGIFVKLDPALHSNLFFESLNKYVTAGFLGVDVFFVISGFLMTSIIFNKVLTNNNRPMVAVWSFWKARAKRIVPALLVAAIFFFIIVVQLFEPNRLVLFVKEIRDALLFTSNFRFARAEGYFTQSVLEKVWLHTWSLSVEWQFYILYPLILLASKKFLGINKTRLVVIVLTIASIVISLVFPMSPKSYFMLHIRAWELLLGGTVYLYPYHFKDFLKQPFQILGLCLIITSVVINKEQPIWNLSVPSLAVIGTALVLWVNNKNILLDNKVAQYLGKISYSLYIYHWPVLVILSLLGLLNPLAVIVIIFLLSALSYHFIEKRRNYGYKTLAVFFVSIGLFVQIEVSKGWEWRFNELDYNFNLRKLNILDTAFNHLSSEKDHYLAPNPEILLAGDSHAAQFSYALTNTIHTPLSYSMFSGSMQFNDLIISVHPQMNGGFETMCNNFDYRLKQMKKLQGPRIVLISQYWALYENIFYANADKGEYIGSICKLKEQDCTEIRASISFRDLLYKELSEFTNQHKDINFIILGDLFTILNRKGFQEYSLISTPLSKLYKAYNEHLSHNPNILLTGKYERIDTSQIDGINSVLGRVAKEQDNVIFIDLSAKLCKNSICQTQTDDNKPIFVDRDHLTNAGASLFLNDIIYNLHKLGIK